MIWKDYFITFEELAPAIHYDSKLTIKSFEDPEELLLSDPVTLRDMKFEEYNEIRNFPVRRIIPEGEKLIIYLEDNG